MKLLIASDLHGSAEFCRDLLRAWDREKAERMLLLGDILYHGPRNDLPEAYAPKEVISLLNEKKNRILCVRGNCDTEVDQMVLDFPLLADYAMIWIDGFAMYATHGHLYHPDHLPPLTAGDILLYGHTHIPSWEKREIVSGAFAGSGHIAEDPDFPEKPQASVLCLNPGSVAIPKAHSPHSYMIFENGVFQWKTLAGEVFHRLDVVRP